MLYRCPDPTNNSDYAFQLPPGYRNSKDGAGDVFVPAFWGQFGGTAAYVRINAGLIEPRADAAEESQEYLFSLEGITFRCRPSGEDGCP
jgi:hypothetical protein